MACWSYNLRKAPAWDSFEFIESVKSISLADEIYVSAEGRIVELPAGATPVVAYAVHTDIERTVGA